MKINLKDVTFLITVQPDSIVRIENLLMTTDFLITNFDCNINVLEVSTYNNHIIEKMIDSSINYIFMEDNDTIFYRTKYLNLMVETVKTEYICIWDVDTIIPPNQIAVAINHLRYGKFNVAIPYDGKALDTSFILRSIYQNNKNIDFLIKHKNKMKILHNNTSLQGGAIFIKLTDYLRAGKENPFFYGWGGEDFERIERWKTLGYNICYTNGFLFHLSHPRGMNSKYSNIVHFKNTEEELFDTKKCSFDEISSLIQARNLYTSFLLHNL